jgi:hypothetical protein
MGSQPFGRVDIAAAERPLPIEPDLGPKKRQQVLPRTTITLYHSDLSRSNVLPGIEMPGAISFFPACGILAQILNREKVLGVLGVFA